MKLKKKEATEGKTKTVNPTVVVTARRRTLEEERHFQTAFQLLLAEIVRQQLGRGGKT